MLQHTAWITGDQCAWMTACVAIASDAKQPLAGSAALLCCMLCDNFRVCIPPSHVGGTDSHIVWSEYAGMVATFL